MFKINGTQVAEPAFQGITITDEPIWAPNTGRAQDGTMTGDFVGWKRTVAGTWRASPSIRPICREQYIRWRTA